LSAGDSWYWFKSGTLFFSQVFYLNCVENFEASNICADAKETCYNWFSKIGAVQDLLPRM